MRTCTSKTSNLCSLSSFSFSLFFFSFLFSRKFWCIGLWLCYHNYCTCLHIVSQMHPGLFLFLFLQFFYDYLTFNVSLSLNVRQFLSPARISSYSSGKLFKTWIIKSTSVVLPFKLNLFIQVCTDLRSIIWVLLNSFLLIMVEFTFQLNKDEAVCGTYLSKLQTFVISHQYKWYLSRSGIGILDIIRLSEVNLLNSPNFTIFSLVCITLKSILILFQHRNFINLM